MRAAAIPGGSTSRPTRCCTSAAPTSWPRPSSATTPTARVEGLLVRYLHFYGGFDTIATHRRWYRREVRAVRLDPGARHPALPGRAGLPGRTRASEDPGAAHRRGDVPLRLGPSGAGAAREAGARQDDVSLARAPTSAAAAARPGFRASGRSGRRIRPWRGPGSSRARHDPERVIAPPPVPARVPALLRLRTSIERLTGARVFEFRNYTLV